MSWLDPVFIGLSVVGFAGLVWIVLALALAVWTRRPFLGVTWITAASVWGADLLTLAVKQLVDRPRPFAALSGVDPLLEGTIGSSLPSGHAATSFAGAVILSFLLRRAVPALFALAVLVAYSRVYVGVHYPLDVLAGAAIGTAVALAVSGAVHALRPPPSEGRQRSEAAPPAG